MSVKIKLVYVVTLVFCIVEFLGFSGIIYGWGALVFVLKRDGYFTNDCPSNANFTEELHSRNSSTYNYVEDEPNSDNACSSQQAGCSKQDASLNLVFTIGAFCIQGSAFIWGLLYDRLGTRFTRIAFSIFELAGCLLIGFSSRETSILLIPAIALLASGGIAILIANMQVSNLFGQRKSTVMTGLCGCFDSSSSIMLFVKLGYERGISVRIAFFILAGCTLIFNINTFLLLPSKHIPWPLPANYIVRRKKKAVEVENPEKEAVMLDNITKEKTKEDSDNVPAYEQLSESKPSGETTAAAAASMQAAEAARRNDYPTLKSCVCSPLFVLALLFTAILQLRMIFFLGTFNPWLETLTGCQQETVSFYTTVFVFCQSTGIVMSPLCGLLLDRNKSKSGKGLRGPYSDLQDSALVFAITSILFMLFSTTILIPVLEVQFVTFILHVVTRSFLYSLVASATPIFFPIQYFGTLYGVLLALAGIFGLLQYPLFLMWKNLLNNDPFYVNIGLLVLCSFTFALPIYIYIHAKKKSSQGVPIQ